MFIPDKIVHGGHGKALQSQDCFPFSGLVYRENLQEYRDST